MDSVDLDVLRKSVQWMDEGRGVTLVTIVRTWGSAPRPIGAMSAIRDDGIVAGSVSGGCVEDDLLDKVRSGELTAGGPKQVIYGVTQEQAGRFGLPCGGTLELVVEPLTEKSKINQILTSVERHQLITRRLSLATGIAEIEVNDGVDTLAFDGKTLVTTHGPRWRLLIIGATQLSAYLAQFAQALDYRVTICDPRDEYALDWKVSGTTLTRNMPDDTVLEMVPDAHMAVVAVTHDPKLDDLALMEALKSQAFYIGALGSRKNNESRRKRLLQFDVSPDEVARLHGPVGLRLGGKTPPEICIAILAEMTAVRYGVPLDAVADKSQPSNPAPVDPDPYACRVAA